jgi:hypothetical protein
LANARTPVMRRKLENTHSCGKTALKLIRRIFRRRSLAGNDAS